MKNARERVVEIAKGIGISLRRDWKGCDPILPILERIRADGGVILLQFVGIPNQPPFFVDIVGAVMSGNFVRVHGATLEDALAGAITEYVDWKCEGHLDGEISLPSAVGTPTPDLDRQATVVAICEALGIAHLPKNWRGIDTVWPCIDRLRSAGVVVLLKLDGERTDELDTGQYTAAASGNGLVDSVRIDASNVEDALGFVIIECARQLWNWNG